MDRDNSVKPRLFGKVTATVTHELQNVLAIIKENAGLMDDLISLTPDEEAKYLPPRLSKCLVLIKQQVKRGVGLTSNLNGFAHTADQSVQKVDVIKLTQRLLELTGRLSQNAGVETTLKESLAPLCVETDPLQLQACLQLSLECLLSLSPPGSIISLYFKGNKAIASIELIVENETQSVSDMSQALVETSPWDELEHAAQAINVSSVPAIDGIVLKFI